LGQCCGGVSRLMVEVFSSDRLDGIADMVRAEQAGPFTTRGRIGDGGVSRAILTADMEPGQVYWDGAGGLVETFGDDRRQIYLFGAGHVGRALILALAPLPFDVIWTDPRKDAFPGAVPGNVKMVCTSDATGQLAHAPDGSFIVVLTHSHALDLDLVQTALKAGRFGYVGVIGSATKRARFVSRMRKAGLEPGLIDTLVCPIGAGGVASKRPAVIAAGVATELLVRDELVKSRQKPVQFSLHEVTLNGG
ncbi:MAG: xanthine dehydrogenase accessory protein XdhC, partial [Aestuariivirgaceae bacterium]